MYIAAIALLCLAVVPVTPTHHDIHKRMTNEEVLQVFQTDHINVPPYDVVRVAVSNMEKRDTESRRTVRMTGSNTDVEVMLKCSDGFLAGENTPVMEADVSTGQLRYVNLPNVMRKVGRLMEDTRTRSSMVMSKTTFGRHAFNGYIGTRNLVVRSLPDHLSDEVSRKARSVDDSVSSDDSVYHIVYEPEERPVKPNYSTRLLNETDLQPVSNRNRRTIPEIIYPEVMLVVDYSSYRLHGSNIENVVRYVLALWNSADMRYRLLTQPKIRINIARIIIAKVPEATPYIFSGVINGNIVNADTALDKAGQYFYSIKEKIPLKSYDAVMMMTKHALATNDGGSPAGYAGTEAACLYNDYQAKFFGNGIFQDEGLYKSVVPAHELGHILGSHHDIKDCPSSYGYVMAPVAPSDLNSWTFSPCSVRDFRKYLNSKERNTECLHNRPSSVGRLVPRTLGGFTVSLDEQCRKIGGSEVCPFKGLVKNPDVCAQLYCRSKDRGNGCMWLKGVGALDGSPCSGNGICLRGECVKR